MSRSAKWDTPILQVDCLQFIVYKERRFMPKPRSQTPGTWSQELSSRYNAGIVHAFLLHGNISDYINGVAGQTLRNYLLASFSKREVVLYWNRAVGFVFAKPTMKRLFAEMCGLIQP